MTDREDSAEFSEATRRFVEELGQLMSDEAGRGSFDLSVRLSPTADADADRELVLEEKLSDLEAEIDQARRELRRLQEMRGHVLRQLEPSDDRAFRLDPGDVSERMPMSLGSGLVSAQRGGMKLRATPEIIDYLEPVQTAAQRQRSGSFWLHGDDARERLRAVSDVVALLNSANRQEWTVAEVEFESGPGRRPTSAPRTGAVIARAVRSAWDSWDDERPPPDLLRHLEPMQARRRIGPALAIVLFEFPARRRKASPFLSWLNKELLVGGLSMMVVSADKPPPSGLGFEAVLCESGDARRGRRLSALRLQKGWNRGRLAEAAGMSQSDLVSLESGLREAVDPGTMGRLANALGVHLRELDKQG